MAGVLSHSWLPREWLPGKSMFLRKWCWIILRKCFCAWVLGSVGLILLGIAFLCRSKGFPTSVTLWVQEKVDPQEQQRGLVLYQVWSQGKQYSKCRDRWENSLIPVVCVRDSPALYFIQLHCLLLCLWTQQSWGLDREVNLSKLSHCVPQSWIKS